MPREIPQPELQKGQAITYRNNGKTIREFTGIFKTDKNAIAEFLKNLDFMEKGKKLQDPKKQRQKSKEVFSDTLKKRS